MTRSVVIDEWHVTVRIPAGLPEPEAEAVRQTLLGGTFLTQLRAAIRTVVREFPVLAAVRVSLTR